VPVKKTGGTPLQSKIVEKTGYTKNVWASRPKKMNFFVPAKKWAGRPYKFLKIYFLLCLRKNGFAICTLSVVNKFIIYNL